MLQVHPCVPVELACEIIQNKSVSGIGNIYVVPPANAKPKWDENLVSASVVLN